MKAKKDTAVRLDHKTAERVRLWAILQGGRLSMNKAVYELVNNALSRGVKIVVK